MTTPFDTLTSLMVMGRPVRLASAAFSASVRGFPFGLPIAFGSAFFLVVILPVSLPTGQYNISN